MQMTAFVIMITGAHKTDLDSAQLTAETFNRGFFGKGHYIFAYSTIISWLYYGDRCGEFLFGTRAIIWYR